MPYSLKLITPSGKNLEDTVDSLVAPGISGSLGILAKHAPMINLLSEGTLKITKDGGDRFYQISSGILEVGSNGNVIILADKAVESSRSDGTRN